MPRVIELFVDQFLAIAQGFPANNPQGAYVFQTIAFQDQAKNYRTVAEIAQTIFFGEVVEARRSIQHISVSDYLSFYQRGGNGPELQTLTQFFHIGQEARVVEFEQLAQSLAFTQLATAVAVKNAMNTIVFVDLASCNIIKSIEVFHTLTIGSGGTGYILDEESYSITLPTLTGPNAPEC